ncbi:MAG: hypothetical protein M3Q99_10405 [Acidobacteriota bacterium]|nr:hypothetical protein [Acidobacteriota bacterium]
MKFFPTLAGFSLFFLAPNPIFFEPFIESQTQISQRHFEFVEKSEERKIC